MYYENIAENIVGLKIHLLSIITVMNNNGYKRPTYPNAPSSHSHAPNIHIQ